MNIQLLDQAAQQAAIRAKYATLITPIEEIWTTCNGFLAAGQRTGVGVDADVRLCALAVHAKMIRLSYVAFTLCFEGLALEAQSQARVFFESYVHLKFLFHAQDRPACAREYRIWDISNDDLELVRREIVRNPGWDQVFGPDLRDADGLKAALGDAEWRKFVRWGPVRESFSRLVDIVGNIEATRAIDGIHRSLYHETSGQVHGFDNQDYAVRTGANDVFAKLGPSDDKVEPVALSVLSMLVDGMKLTCALLALDNEAALAELDRRTKEVMLARI